MKREVKVLERYAAFQGYFRVDRCVLRHTRHDGTLGAPIRREIFERGHAVAVLPHDPVRDRVVLVEQFRPGAWAAGIEPWLMEVIAGIIDPGETPEDVVRREAREEAGLTFGPLTPIATIALTPGGASETLRIYYATADLEAAAGIFGLDHEGEDIKVHNLSVDEALAMLAAGRIVNAGTVIALQWLALNRDRLTRGD
ncbi:MAG: NUDIX domain-containing protein [Alphaproteobacteria bacterium]|nr:NUDIX domain-containing protein [Alphaproteobacteria bacterium]